MTPPLATKRGILTKMSLREPCDAYYHGTQINSSCHIIINHDQTNALNRRDAEVAEFSKGFLRVLCDSAVIL
jgi:hypothetical protein